MTQPYKIEFIAGGVIKDAAGNIVDDSSERIAVAKNAHATAFFEAEIVRQALKEADAKVAAAAAHVAQVEAEITAERNTRNGES